jgi:hypothetical protein
MDCLRVVVVVRWRCFNQEYRAKVNRVAMLINKASGVITQGCLCYRTKKRDWTESVSYVA